MSDNLSVASVASAADTVRRADLGARPSSGPEVSLTDAAEEVAQFFSQARLQERSLKEREIGPYESPALERAGQVEALLEVLWADDQKSGLDARLLAGQLLASAGNPATLDRTLKALGGSTEQFLLLSHALAQGAAHGDRNPALEALRDRIDLLWARDGVRIRADVNTAPALPAAADRQAYRDAVLDGGTLPRTLALLLGRYGGDIESAVARLRQALGADIGAARPSLPMERLRAILHDLFIVGAVLPFLKNCRDLHRRLGLRRRKGQGRGNGQGREEQDDPDTGSDEGGCLLGELAEWVPRWLTLGDVRSLLYLYHMSMEQDAAAPASQAERVLVFLHGIRAVLRQLPERLFPDVEHKANVDQVLAGLLDELILGAPDDVAQQFSS